MKTSALTEIEEIAVSKKDNLPELFQKLGEQIPYKESWILEGPKTFDKNFDKGWNKDGH